jgi:hypothetical protein
MLTGITGPRGWVLSQAIHGFRKNARKGGLARTSGSGKKVGVSHVVLGDRVPERLNDVILARYFVPASRTVLSVDCLIHTTLFMQFLKKLFGYGTG